MCVFEDPVGRIGEAFELLTTVGDSRVTAKIEAGGSGALRAGCGPNRGADGFYRGEGS
ncbi:MAG: hypothetical protein GY925_25165 [Actinomycetia bacterium]|nr:hypothetical protein [Actinomycetes bacterium]